MHGVLAHGTYLHCLFFPKNLLRLFFEITSRGKITSTNKNNLARSILILVFKGIFSWWTFRPRKKIFSPPPPNSPIRRRHPPGPSAPLPPGDPPPGIFKKKINPPPPGASDSPFPLPEQKKIKNIRNVHQVLRSKITSGNTTNS